MRLGFDISAFVILVGLIVWTIGWLILRQAVPIIVDPPTPADRVAAKERRTIANALRLVGRVLMNIGAVAGMFLFVVITIQNWR